MTVRRNSRAPRRLLPLAVAAVLLAGCRSEVRSEIHAFSDGTATMTVNVVLADEAAQAADGDRDQLRSAVASAAGVGVDAVEVKGNRDELVASVELDYDQLRRAADLTGVGDAMIGPPPAGRGGDNDRAVTVSLVTPSRLTQVLTEAARDAGKDSEDAEALADAVLASTDVVVVARFDSGVTDAYFTPRRPELAISAVVVTDGDTASVRMALNRFSPGQFVVIGDPSKPGGSTRSIALVVVLGAGLAGAIWYDRRHRPARRR